MLSNSKIEETDTSRYFRRTFVEKFDTFITEAKMLAKGNADFNDTWKDTLGKEGLGLSVAVIVGIIAVLGAVSVLSAAATAGASLLVAVAGALGGVAFYKTRQNIKQRRYQRADEMLDRDDIHDEIENIANLLADIYKMQLSNCTLKDAHVLAEGCVKTLTDAMLKSKSFDFNELLYPSSLQGSMMRSLSFVPKVRLDMNVMTNKKLNMRGLVGHSAYYCRETDEFYQTKKSKSIKYGVLFFDKKSDLDDYESILTTTLRGGQKWKFTKMRPHEVNVMKRSSLFREFDNDAVYQDETERRSIDEVSI